RLELSRTSRPPAVARVALLAAVAVFIVGVGLTAWWPGTGIRIAGAGLLAQAMWLGRFDVARHTVRMHGATRYMALALIAGFVWLAVAAVAWIAQGALTGGGFAYDAMLHAIFVGFVFSMIFAHAPVIVPAVLGVALPFRQSFYLPLVLLHGSLIVRLLGDAAGNEAAWRWGGVLNELAIVLYLTLAASSAARHKRARASSAARRTA
ncbi:MAG: hypothetical protein JJE27_08140, partial [Thermoleophilia bacterium]|nr:hypothetical protein [Thermoleophilia bacterium]